MSVVEEVTSRKCHSNEGILRKSEGSKQGGSLIVSEGWACFFWIIEVTVSLAGVGG